MWEIILSAPFAQLLELAVLDEDGMHRSCFPVRDRWRDGSMPSPVSPLMFILPTGATGLKSGSGRTKFLCGAATSPFGDRHDDEIPIH